MSIKDKLTQMQELNKTIHDAINATVKLCGGMSAELQGDFEEDDARAVMKEILDAAEVCKIFAASVTLSAMECMKEDKEDEDHV